jgi:NAD(P)H-nitrite reductase large subunit
METTQTGIFVAGDTAGIGGAYVASEEGKLAALEACRQSGYLDEKQYLVRSKLIRKRLRNLYRFENVLNRMFQVGPFLYKRITDETVVCRCEEITAGEVRRLIRDGVTDIRGIKGLTRAGMGICQGRMCELTIGQLIAAETGFKYPEAGILKVRPPVKPVTLEALAKMDIY